MVRINAIGGAFLTKYVNKIIFILSRVLQTNISSQLLRGAIFLLVNIKENNLHCIPSLGKRSIL